MSFSIEENLQARLDKAESRIQALEAKLAECTAKLTSALEDLDETDEKMHEALNLSAKYKTDLVEALRLGDALVPYAQVSGSSHRVVYAWKAFRSRADDPSREGLK